MTPSPQFKDTPLTFSIVIPVYNAAALIGPCIESVINQSYSHWELLVIDAGSTDGTVDIIKKYDGKIAYWESVKDDGQTYAINKGLKRARGDILCWINADERYLPNALKLVADAYLKNRFELCFGNTFLQDLNETFRFEKKLPPIPPFWYILLYGDVIPSEATFWSRSLQGKCGLLNEKEYPRLSMDFEWFLRLSYTAKKWHRISKPLCTRIDRPDASTNAAGADRIKENREMITNAFFKDFKWPSALRPLVYFSQRTLCRIDPWAKRNRDYLQKLAHGHTTVSAGNTQER